MERERKFKIVALVAVIIAVIGLSIAFAAMSRTLNINGRGNVDPANFDIYFTNLSQPTLKGEASVSGTPTLATKGVTISNMNVTLKKPNDSVVYKVDIKNDGDIDAEIENLVLPTFTSAQQELFDFTVVYTNGGQAVSIGDTLAKGETKNVTITFKYKDITDESLLPSTAQQISLSYQIIYKQTNKEVLASGSGGQNSGQQTSNCTPFTKKDTYVVGDVISICNNTTGKSEDFYVISDNGTTVTALAKYNLYVGRIYNSSTSYVEIDQSDEKYGIQNSKAIGYYKNTHPMYEENDNKLFPVIGVVSFANKNYWNGNTSSYPAWVFNNNSNLWTPIQNYQTYLQGLGKTSVSATLLDYSQASIFNCSGSSCSSNTPWAYATSYWLGTAYNSSIIYALYSYGKYDYYSYNRNGYCGIRPVITINKSEL